MPTVISSHSRTLASLSVGLAQSPRERHRALELRRDVYIRKGLLRDDIRQPRVVPQACAPGSAIFVATEHDAIVGTITFYMDSVIGLPIDEVHREEVDAMRRRCGRVAEVGGLAVREDRRGAGITMLLYQATFRWALATHAHGLVACVNPSCRRVYTKRLLFEVLGDCKPHPRFRAAPSIPIGLDLTTAPRRYSEAHAGTSEDPLQPFFGDPDPQYTGATLDSATYLQWSDDEVSEMIRTEQLILSGDDHLYVELNYSTRRGLRPLYPSGARDRSPVSLWRASRA
jgi:GNAT superfamily N-acetyltransferase